MYLSHVNPDDWGGNQLGDATILPGQSFTLNNVACDQQQVKVMAVDQNGFLSTVVNCSDSVTWTNHQRHGTQLRELKTTSVGYQQSGNCGFVLSLLKD